MTLTIHIGVGGRFHSDFMARAFLARNDDVTLYTTFPKDRFRFLPPERIRTYLFPEIVFRLAAKVGQENWGDTFKMQAFGRALAAASTKQEPDLFLGWSSFCVETFRAMKHGRKILLRDSAHIDFQTEILERAYRALGHIFPSRKIARDREREEYALSDHLIVPSEFARRTFLERGVPAEKISVLRLGVDTSLFHPGETETDSGPLRVVYFGTLSIQKGVPQLLEAAARFSPTELSLELIGSVTPEVQPLLSRYPGVTHTPALPQTALAARLRQKQVFVMPSLHDGYGQVVPQAMASGLAVISTDHCGASELIKSGTNGVVVPANSVEHLAAALQDLRRRPDYRRELAQRAPLSIGEITWESYAGQLVEWAHSVAAGAGRKAS